jgi:phage gpG-like protein
MGEDSLSYIASVDARGRAVITITGLKLIDPDNWRPLGYAISKIIRRSLAATIDQGGRPEKFAPLAPSTIAKKKSLGQPLTPLIATKALRDSLARRNFKGNVTYVAATGELRVGTNIPYAKYHLPSSITGVASTGKIPVRNFLVLLPEDWAAIKDLIRDWQIKKVIPGDDD